MRAIYTSLSLPFKSTRIKLILIRVAALYWLQAFPFCSCRKVLVQPPLTQHLHSHAQLFPMRSQIQLWSHSSEEKQGFTEERFQQRCNLSFQAPNLLPLSTYFLLTKSLCLSGAFGPCLVLFDGLEIKHIEQDILG